MHMDSAGHDNAMQMLTQSFYSGSNLGATKQKPRNQKGAEAKVAAMGFEKLSSTIKQKRLGLEIWVIHNNMFIHPTNEYNLQNVHPAVS